MKTEIRGFVTPPQENPAELSGCDSGDGGEAARSSLAKRENSPSIILDGRRPASPARRSIKAQLANCHRQELPLRFFPDLGLAKPLIGGS